MPFDPVNYILFWAVIGSIVLFYRQIYNFLIFVFWHKDFVVVHIRKTATRKQEVWYAIPNANDNFFTKVGLFKGRSYDLNPAKSAFEIKSRKHHIHNEEDFMPMKFHKIWFGLRKKIEHNTENYHPIEKDIKELDKEVIFVFNGQIYFKSDNNAVPLALDPRTDDDYIIGSKRVTSGMEAKQMRIFSEGKNPLIMVGLVVLVVVAFIIILYGISEYQKLAPLVQEIYARTVIGNGSMTISPK